MSSAATPNPRPASVPPDELDRILDYDAAAEDLMNEMPVRGDAQDATTTAEQPRDEDREVQVKKKRQPIPKLDENRLLSQAGIPKLRSIGKSRLKFRGKGHEFSDISRLLNAYQLWLDDLYPRAKFRDALGMVEKVGHSKRMQVARRAWLDDTKPHRRLSPDRDFDMFGTDGGVLEAAASVAGKREDSRFRETAAGQSAAEKPSQAGFDHDAPDDDELDALLAENGSATAPVGASSSRRHGPFVDDEPDEDELDALLAESGASRSTAAAGDSGPLNEQSSRPTGAMHNKSTVSQELNDFADDGNATAMMSG